MTNVIAFPIVHASDDMPTLKEDIIRGLDVLDQASKMPNDPIIEKLRKDTVSQIIEAVKVL